MESKNNFVDTQISAVKSGYWHLFRYNPNNKTPLSIDSAKPTNSLSEHMLTERRYSNYYDGNKKAEFEKLQQEQNSFYDLLVKLSKLYNE